METIKEGSIIKIFSLYEPLIIKEITTDYWIAESKGVTYNIPKDNYLIKEVIS